MSGVTRTCYTFGPFRLDASGGVLFKEDQPVGLPPKAVEMLRVLVSNSGRTVRRDELMAAVWPDTFVEEANLTVTVSVLRKALEDNREQPQYIETVPKRGYRFVAPVEVEATPAPDALQASRAMRRRARVWTAAGVGAALLAVVLFLLLPPRAPRVVRTVQLTRTGLVDSDPSVVTDGVRLYFNQRQGAKWGVFQVSVDGGDPAPVATPFASTLLFDISPDHSSLLIGDFIMAAEAPVWVLPLTGGSSRRLGEITASDAAWTPDGRHVLYTNDRALYIAGLDGGGRRKLAAVDGYPRRPRMHPSGRLVRFNVRHSLGGSSLWQVAADGSGLHRLGLVPKADLPPPEGAELGESDGTWTPDGRFFLFRSVEQSVGGGYRTTLWSYRDVSPLGFAARPVPLYVSPQLQFGPVISRDGKRLFVIGKQQRHELVRYDPATRQFAPFLAGVSISSVEYSRDGEWIAYVSLPDRTLWRSRANGGDRLQLTFAPRNAFYPRWSPDGRRIAFMSMTGETAHPQQIAVISRDGGAPEAVLTGLCDNPTWSPDGHALLYMSATGLQFLDLAARKSAPVPDSAGMGSPAWSPDGRYIAAVSEDQRILKMYDLETKHWQDAARGIGVCHLRWSPDSQAVYFQDCYGGAALPVFRLRIKNRDVEQVTPSEPTFPAGVVAFSFTGLTPGEAVLATFTRNNSDLYALQLE